MDVEPEGGRPGGMGEGKWPRETRPPPSVLSAVLPRWEGRLDSLRARQKQKEWVQIGRRRKREEMQMRETAASLGRGVHHDPMWARAE